MLLPPDPSALVQALILLSHGALGACVAWLVWRAFNARFGECRIRPWPIAWLGFWIACLVWLFSTSVWAFQAAEASVFESIRLVGHVLLLLHRHPIPSTIAATAIIVSGGLFLLCRVKPPTIFQGEDASNGPNAAGPDGEEARDERF